MRVSRATLVKRLRDRVGLGQADANACLESLLGLIQDSLVLGDDVRLVGFGQFTLHDRAARTAIHPTTGREVAVPARRVVQFRPARALKELIDRTPVPDADAGDPQNR
jgi:nucleoid DNA-binding protein